MGSKFVVCRQAGNAEYLTADGEWSVNVEDAKRWPEQQAECLMRYYNCEAGPTLWIEEVV